MKIIDVNQFIILKYLLQYKYQEQEIKKEGDSMEKFNKTVKKLMPTLEKFVPIVDKVHGKHHPEFHDVRKIFDTINDKAKEAGAEKPDLSQEFTLLREVTDNYTVPGDVCESYEAVYKMLSELEESYKV